VVGGFQGFALCFKLPFALATGDVVLLFVRNLMIFSWHDYTIFFSSAIVYPYMGTSPNNGDDKNVPPNSSTVILLLLTMADTTWRLFVPTVGLTVLGLVLDKQFATTPWLMIVGVVIGTVLAVLLVKLQLKKVKK
jgi:hypothetical protein